MTGHVRGHYYLDFIIEDRKSICRAKKAGGFNIEVTALDQLSFISISKKNKLKEKILNHQKTDINMDEIFNQRVYFKEKLKNRPGANNIKFKLSHKLKRINHNKRKFDESYIIAFSSPYSTNLPPASFENFKKTLLIDQKNSPQLKAT